MINTEFRFEKCWEFNRKISVQTYNNLSAVCSQYEHFSVYSKIVAK